MNSLAGQIDEWQEPCNWRQSSTVLLEARGEISYSAALSDEASLPRPISKRFNLKGYRFSA